MYRVRAYSLAPNGRPCVAFGLCGMGFVLCYYKDKKHPELSPRQLGIWLY